MHTASFFAVGCPFMRRHESSSSFHVLARPHTSPLRCAAQGENHGGPGKRSKQPTVGPKSAHICEETGPLWASPNRPRWCTPPLGLALTRKVWVGLAVELANVGTREHRRVVTWRGKVVTVLSNYVSPRRETRPLASQRTLPRDAPCRSSLAVLVGDGSCR